MLQSVNCVNNLTSLLLDIIRQCVSDRVNSESLSSVCKLRINKNICKSVDIVAVSFGCTIIHSDYLC
jgi:hypothetical protein